MKDGLEKRLDNPQEQPPRRARKLKDIPVREELNRLRLSRMLKALGINIDRYTHQQSAVNIQRQMKNCVSCANISICDEKIENGQADPDYLDFCANADELQRVKAANE